MIAEGFTKEHKVNVSVGDRVIGLLFKTGVVDDQVGGHARKTPLRTG